MMTAIKREKTVTEKTNYMEVLGTNRVIYRVTSSKKLYGDKEYVTYGVEAEMKIGPVKFLEKIDDFSDDVKQAVGFAELLVNNNIKPALIYNAALCYLRKII
ncbi:MAG: hypothetical protein IJX24_03485 [Oscillospiraceae bacterium]|nr:hypothetical protein [Oscillospiraceae bacterium]